MKRGTPDQGAVRERAEVQSGGITIALEDGRVAREALAEHAVPEVDDVVKSHPSDLHACVCHEEEYRRPRRRLHAGNA